MFKKYTNDLKGRKYRYNAMHKKSNVSSSVRHFLFLYRTGSTSGGMVTLKTGR